ncbi:hypothetical protein P4O66_005054, partial [Electrophorus voltai]
VNMSKNHARIEMDLLNSFTFGAAPRVPGTVGGQNGLVASLADVGFLDHKESDVSGKNRQAFVFKIKWEAESGLAFRSQHWQPLRRRRSLPSLHGVVGAPQSQALVNDEAIQKISILENELAKLRAQIAQIVQTQELSTQSAGLTSALAPGSLPVPPPPPPPPPPLPPPGPRLQRSVSAIDIIKERRCKKVGQQTVESEPRQPEIPSMLDVLKDMGKVKLRSIKNRPKEGHPKPKTSEPTDAATLIAEALKRKFAHRYRANSECEGNFSLPPQESKPHPEAPAFGQHMLKSTGKRNLF